jgi:ABC-2 type transport system ATP-binding protein
MIDAIVSTRHLGKTVNAKPILCDISLEVTPGNVVGVIGKNGAGKTTLLDVLLGFSPATTGTATVFGADSFELPTQAKRRIGYVPQQDELVDSLTGAQQLALAASLHDHWDAALIGRLTAEWEVPLERPVQALSGGERQKLSTLLALGHEPDLLVLDEPAASLDPVARRQFLRQVLDIAESAHRVVIFSTHIVADLERVANQVWIIRDGSLVWAGELDALKESVVRLVIRGRGTLPAPLGLTDVLSQRVDGKHGEAIVSAWDVSRHRDLERRLDAEIDVQTLGLEDIFLEFHR